MQPGTALADRDADRSYQAPHEWIWAPIAALALLAARVAPLDRLPFLFCPFHALTGLPCLSCGGTRAMMALSRLDVRGALAMNPLVALLGLAGAAYVVHAVGVGLLGWRPWRPRVRTAGGRRALRVVAFVIVAMNWAYLIAVGR